MAIRIVTFASIPENKYQVKSIPSARLTLAECLLAPTSLHFTALLRLSLVYSEYYPALPSYFC